MNKICPQYVKFNNSELLPDSVKGRIMGYYSLGGLIANNGITAIYYELSLIDSLHIFVKTISDNFDVLFSGTDTFIPGVNYYISDNISQDYDFCLPTYWTVDNQINDLYFDYLPSLFSVDEYYIKQNNALNNVFTEDELNNFYSTFCKVILDNSSVDNIITTTDSIYYSVLNYFYNFKTDSAQIGIGLILGNMFATPSQSSASCGCNSGIGSLGAGDNTAICSASCLDYYKQAMLSYLIAMLSDTNFYKNWFFVTDSETGISFVNEVLCNLLITLLDEFINLGNDLTFTKTTGVGCSCPVPGSSESECNYKILNNYKQVLEWVKNNEIDANSNKIKIYGEQFGELLPKLQF